MVRKLTEHELEVNTHVWVVVKRHQGALLDEEEDKAIVFGAFNGDPV